jgi:hypothetical protein
MPSGPAAPREACALCPSRNGQLLVVGPERERFGVLQLQALGERGLFGLLGDGSGFFGLRQRGEVLLVLGPDFLGKTLISTTTS